MALPPHVVDVPGGSEQAERTFQTYIDPASDEILLPVAFVSKWESDLCSQYYGWIRDPAGNYIRMDLTKVIEESMIPGGLMISQHCGFVASQRVVLCYQIFDNQFNMRIVTDEGVDIPYFGFHSPINYHAMKVADPAFVAPVGFISVVDDPNDDGDVGMAIPFELFKDYMVVNNSVDGQPDIEGPTPMYAPADNGLPEEYIWSVNVSVAVAEGRSVLHIPRFVVENFEFAVEDEIDVVDDDTGETADCRLKTSVTPSGYIVRYLTRGWYQYVRSKEISPGDKIVLGVTNPVTVVTLTVFRG